MLSKTAAPPVSREGRKQALRELMRDRHFETLMMQSWNDMRARSRQ